jgi:hypothetical protein
MKFRIPDKFICRESASMESMGSRTMDDFHWDGILEVFEMAEQFKSFGPNDKLANCIRKYSCVWGFITSVVVI